MNVKSIKTETIKPYKKNAKKHPKEQIQHIANSIKEFGWQQPLVLDKDNVVIIGHGRLEAAKVLNLQEVPCVYADDLSEEQIKALRLADNKVAESEWDLDLLGKEIDDIFELDMSDFGFEEKQEDDEVEIKTVELQPYRKVHYLVTLDINDNDKVAEIMVKLRNTEGIEVESTIN